MLLALSDRPIDSNTTFTTGGDVSRFQRRTVPARTPSAPTGNGPASSGAPVAIGPVVRIARGNDVTVVPVGAR
jgi:pilus assembly protein CpaB